MNQNKNTNTTGKTKGSKKYNNSRKRAKNTSGNSPVSAGDISKDTSYKGPNDPAWYVPTDQNLKDAANFSFNNPLGLPNVGTAYPTLATAQYDPNRVPGVMSLWLAPTLGVSKDKSSAVNVASQAIYAQIRRANSGAKNYDSADLMSVILAVASAFSMASFCARSYGIANVYSSQNRFLPNALLASGGIIPSSLVNNLADYRARLNNAILKLNSLTIPSNIPLIQRWVHIYDSYYTDSNTVAPQIFIANPQFFYVRPDDSQSTVTWSNNLGYVKPQSAMSYIAELEEVVGLLLESEDVGTICGDILKAYEGAIVQFPLIPETYTVLPSDSDEIRAQFENAVNLRLDPKSTASIYIDPANLGYIQTSYTLTAVTPYCGFSGDKVINFHKEDVTPEDVMVATRLVPGITKATYSTTTKAASIELSSVGSELLANVTLGVVDPKSETGFKFIPAGNRLLSGLSDINSASSIFLTSAFDWAPETRVFAYKDPADGQIDVEYITYIGSLWDFDNYTKLNLSDINRLNETAIMGELGIPFIK